MFSFFKTKKPSPPNSPESNRGANDFVVVNPSQPMHPGQAPYGAPLYPNFNQNFGIIPGQTPPGYIPGSAPGSMPTTTPGSPTKDGACHHYLKGVPFKLSSELSMGDSNEIDRILVDDILAGITSKMDFNSNDYDFSLERSIIAQD